MNAVGVARQFKCGEKAHDGNWITGIEEMRIHQRLDRLYHFGNIARYCFVVAFEAIIEAKGTIFTRPDVVPFYSVENRELLFRCCDQRM